MVGLDRAVGARGVLTLALVAVVLAGACGRLKPPLVGGRDAAGGDADAAGEAAPDRGVGADTAPADGALGPVTDGHVERADAGNEVAEVAHDGAASDTVAALPDAALADAPPSSETGIPPSPDPADAAASDAFVMGPHPTPPQVRNQGGPVLDHPVLTAITYDGYDLRSTAEDVIATIGASDYWKAATSEYGVGAPTVRAPIHLAETAPALIDDLAIQSWLAARLDGTHPEFGTPTQNTVFVIFYPTGTTVTNATLQSCQAFGGYHGAVGIGAGGAQAVPYVVVPECSSSAGLAATMEASSSHELVEASTDPFGTVTRPGVAWSDVDADHLVWEALLGGGEVTDLCQLLYSSKIIPFPYAHLVQRSWSNAAARAGHDPCVPGYPGEVYFAAAGVLPDTVTFHSGGLDHQTKGVLIDVGASRTIEVDLWSDAPPVLGPWTVSAIDMSPLLGGPADSLAFAWDATTGTNGTKLHLTITVKKAAGLAGGQAFMIQSDAGPRHEWFGFVGQH
jgi:hypothetical protein